MFNIAISISASIESIPNSDNEIKKDISIVSINNEQSSLNESDPKAIKPESSSSYSTLNSNESFLITNDNLNIISTTDKSKGSKLEISKDINHDPFLIETLKKY